MRQHDRVGLGMRQVEDAAERVAELVVQRHADRAQAGAGKERAILRVRARLAVAAGWPRSSAARGRVRAMLCSASTLMIGLASSA